MPNSTVYNRAMNTLVVGGTSGLGLSLAKRFVEDGPVWVVGRTDPKIEGLTFLSLDLTAPKYWDSAAELIKEIPQINRLVYASGFYQDGRITDLSTEQIAEMMNVSFGGAVAFVRAVLSKQEKLETLVAITSTSQWTPRQREPIYNAAKAALAMFANSLAEDGRIDKVLVAGPAGMKTPFWREIQHADFDQMNDPDWVAEQIVTNLADNYRYREIRILRNPPRVEKHSER